MALLDWMTTENPLVVHGDGVRLRHPRASDFAEWAALRARSRDFLQPWEPTWPADDLTRAAFKRRLTAYAREIEAGTGFPFFVFRSEDDRLVGGVTLSNIRRGVAQTATLGYWAGKPHARKGFISRATRAVSHFAFTGLKLHRIEAACLPSNEASKALLLKVGFEIEGRARAYLKINGVWEDHILFGLLNERA